ncbi:MAG: hypothetical protein KI793_13960 [Rivularia sp. (in: Bacteria)]|nr:hypothetical protein [Rivularia sp. MS3]
MEALDRISRIPILITDLVIFLLAIAGFINLIKGIIATPKNSNRKHGSKYSTQDNFSFYVDTTNYHNSTNYDSNSSCDGSFDAGGDCGGVN